MKNRHIVSLDYAIKYILKDKSDYALIEDFVSAILRSAGKKPIKILSLMDGENNKSQEKAKKSIADLLVEDEDKQKYIIEIERSDKDDFVEKALFNIASVVRDSLSTKDLHYLRVPKIIHISLLYSTPECKGVVYYGNTLFRNVETDEIEHVKVLKRDKNTLDEDERRDLIELQEKVYRGKLRVRRNIIKVNLEDPLPEYFFIFVPNFEEETALKIKELHDWLYTLKNDRVPDDVLTPCMEHLAERLDVLKMTPDQQIEYEAYLKEKRNIESALSTARTRGLEEGIQKGEKIGIKKGEKIGIKKGEEIGIKKGKEIGRQEGERKAKKALIINLLSKKFSLEQIAKMMNLTTEEVTELMKD